MYARFVVRDREPECLFPSENRETSESSELVLERNDTSHENPLEIREAMPC